MVCVGTGEGPESPHTTANGRYVSGGKVVFTLIHRQRWLAPPLFPWTLHPEDVPTLFLPQSVSANKTVTVNVAQVQANLHNMATTCQNQQLPVLINVLYGFLWY